MSKESHSVEILPTFPIDIITGSIKHSSFRVTQTGRNIVSPKLITQSSNKGRDGNILKSASIKWKTLSQQEIGYWEEIAGKYTFYSRWTAFISSFFLSVDRYGLDETMDRKLSYISSVNRHKKQEHFANSLKRRNQYKADPMHYKITEATLKKYPVEHICPLIYIRLLDLVEVNNALRCRMVIRTDAIVEYEYSPDPDGDGNSGRYTRKERPRVGDEQFELFHITE